MTHPIEIVGGGLAGLALGLALRRAAVPVVLHEAGAYPRHRVCGEFIAGLDHATVQALGLEAFLRDALPQSEAAWFVREERVYHSTLPQPALGISRYVLDAALADAFRDAGGDLRCHSRVDARAAPPGRVFASGRSRRPSQWLGLKVHATNLHLVADLELHLGDRAYVGLARVDSGTTNVCGLFRLRAQLSAGQPRQTILRRYLRAAGLHELAARLDAARLDPDSACAVAALQYVSRVSPPDRLCIGDACAMIPPYTGNGMAMAFQSAAIALAPLLAFSRGESSWSETCRETNRRLRGRFGVRLVSANLVHPMLWHPGQQRWIAGLARAGLLPFRPLYSLLH